MLTEKKKSHLMVGWAFPGPFLDMLLEGEL
jgi:hypothetical protein